MTTLIFYSLIGGLFSLFGGILLLANEKIAKRIMLSLLAFAAGAFMSASFVDILPEALELSVEPHPILLTALAGFSFYFFIERVLMRSISHSADHSHADHTETLPILVILGDSFHNFLDGVIIALAYIANPALGFVTTLAVAAHEIPQEIGDFTILLNQGWAKKRIIIVNILTSLLSVIGALVGYGIGQSAEAYLPHLLALTAGIFIYIAASDLIPEIHHQAGHTHIYRVVIPFISAIALVYVLVEIAHG